MENQTLDTGVKYRDPKATPLKYHYVFLFFILLSFIWVDFKNLIGDLEMLSAPGFGMLACIDALHLGLCLTCFIGLLEWKKYAPYSLIALLIFELISHMIPEIIECSAYPALMVENLFVVAAVYLAWEIPTAIYYFKRKNLFVR